MTQFNPIYYKGIWQIYFGTFLFKIISFILLYTLFSFELDFTPPLVNTNAKYIQQQYILSTKHKYIPK